MIRGLSADVSAGAWGLRWKRRKLLWRSFRSRHGLTTLVDRTSHIRKAQVLAFAVVRNERARLPFFLSHYRALGVSHFLVVDNSSDDGTAELLAEQPDASLWTTQGSYRDARFGLDWITWLLMRYGHGHWCLTIDADELLIYPHWPERDLEAMVGWLEGNRVEALGALMVDVYPKGPVGSATLPSDGNPLEVLKWFDAGCYRARRKARDASLRVQGGARERAFFADQPRRGPTLNKLPLIRWDRRFAYQNSTHSVLPRRLNLAYDGPGDHRLCGVLIHTKFLPTVVERALEEKARQEHFGIPGDFDSYYDAISANPELWSGNSVEFKCWRKLVELGLMSAGDWH